MLADEFERDGLARVFSSTFIHLAETTFTDPFEHDVVVVAAGRERRRLFGGARHGCCLRGAARLPRPRLRTAMCSAAGAGAAAGVAVWWAVEAARAVMAARRVARAGVLLCCCRGTARGTGMSLARVRNRRGRRRTQNFVKWGAGRATLVDFLERSVSGVAVY